MAITFGLYGLVKKIAPLGSLYGLTLEIGLLLLPTLLYLVYADQRGYGVFLHTDGLTNLLLAGAGVVTTVPLLMFASAVRRIPLSVVGIMQYITPILQFLLGVLIYRETFDYNKWIGFGFVWIALGLFGIEGFLAYQGQTMQAAKRVLSIPMKDK